ncbi:MAG: cation:proton antiporter, partial [Rhodocyclaceae bacterium]|nr:cation:proton antiporter [Rhodocyclaceae bacterium]
LAIILFDSGFETPLKSYRVAAGPALTLATLGVVMTAGLVGLAGRLLFGIGWIEAFLLGSIVASTDAAAVFFLLRVGGLRLRDRVKSTLEIESGANDPMAIFLTVLLVDLWVMREAGTLSLGPGLILAFVQQIGIGGVVGVLGGFAIALFMNSLKDLDPGLFPITGLASALVVYA